MANNPLDDDLLKELGLEPDVGDRTEKDVPQESLEPDEEEESPPSKLKPKPEVIPESSPMERQAFSQGVKKITQNLPVQLVAVLAKKTLTLKEVLAMKQGEVVDFQKLPQDSVDLVVNGKLVGRGELVLVDGKIGIQIRQMVG